MHADYKTSTHVQDGHPETMEGPGSSGSKLLLTYLHFVFVLLTSPTHDKPDAGDAEKSWAAAHGRQSYYGKETSAISSA